MTVFRKMTPIVLAACLGAGSAGADVTAAQVWGDWKAYLEGLGYGLEGTETVSGGTLTVSGLTMDMAMPEGTGSASLTMGDLQFVENGDGTVNVVMPENMVFGFEGEIEDEGPAAMTMSLTQDAPTLLVSGNDAEMTYTYSSARVQVGLDEIVADGQTLSGEDLKFTFSMTDVGSVTRTTTGDLREYEQTGQAATATYDIDVTSPEDGSRVVYNGTANGMKFAGSGSIPTGIDTNDMAAMIAEGFAFEGTFSTAGGSGEFTADGPDGPMSGSTSSTGANVTVGVSGEGLRYDVAQTGIAVQFQASNPPLPIEFSLDRAGFKLLMPVSQADAAQPFELGMTFGGLVLSDFIWSLFDPTAELPRDPATIDLDLAGTAKITQNIFDPEAAAQLMGSPAEFESLDIRTLLIDAVGAKLSGTGELSFLNQGPVPQPVGALDLQLDGANALIDKLIEIGLLAQEQASGARMMMALFAVPAGDDSLTSKIEFTEDGQILANGQRIQ